MFKNYLTIAFRSLWKNKVFSLINILGLAIGISASLIIFLLVNYHFNFDKFQKDGDRIYRVVSNFQFGNEIYRSSGVTVPIGPAVQKELTGLEMTAPFRAFEGDLKITVPAAGTKEAVAYKHQNNAIFADENFCNLMGYQWLAGNAKTSLSQPYQLVLTKSNAKQFFPNLLATQTVGKELYFNDTVRMTVSGVVKDIEQNTCFQFKAFASKVSLNTKSFNPGDLEQWDNTNSASQLLIKISAGTSPELVAKNINNLFKKHFTPPPGDNGKTEFALQTLNDVHFDGEYGTNDWPLANKPTLYSLLAVATFLLLLGCINFINITTAQASKRAKEIGIRKTMGSSRKQLIFQFLSETLLLTLTATIVSVILAPLLLKAFAGFIPADLNFSAAAQPIAILFIFLLIALVTFLSGFYPAIILSKYNPALVLKNQAYANTGVTRSAWLRKSLTISQFVIAQVFIMATLLVSKQISFALNKDMGFKKDAIVYFKTNYNDTFTSKKAVLVNKLKAIPGIALISLSNNPPSSNSTSSYTIKYKDGRKELEHDVQIKTADSNYIKLYQLKLLAGNNLSNSDTLNQYIINQTYATALGFKNPQDAIGKYLLVDNGRLQIPIVGVAADFNQRSIHEPIKPLVLCNGESRTTTINIKLQPQNEAGTSWQATVGAIEKAWKQVYPEYDFENRFFDEEIAKFYDQEKQVSSLLMWTTGLAIFISCLGLLGLVIFTTLQRTKEIGVRKVLGASVQQIVSLISRDFIVLIVLAFVIAMPLAWFGINQWLQNFAYRTDVSIWTFVLAGGAAIVFALITISFQTIKAAIANPVKSLRSE